MSEHKEADSKSDLRKQIAGLIDQIKKLQISNQDLVSAKLTISKVIKRDMETQEQMVILAVHNTENGIIIEVAG